MIKIPKKLRSRPRVEGIAVMHIMHFGNPFTDVPDTQVKDLLGEAWVIDHGKALLCAENGWCGFCARRLSLNAAKTDMEAFFVCDPAAYETRQVAMPAMHEECAHYAIETQQFVERPGQIIMLGKGAKAYSVKHVSGYSQPWIIQVQEWANVSYWKDGLPYFGLDGQGDAADPSISIDAGNKIVVH